MYILHVFLQEARSIVIARNLEITEVERGLGNSIKAVEADIKKTLLDIDNVASDEANLETKIEKKKQEFERNQKRLATLQSVRSVLFHPLTRDLYLVWIYNG